MKPDLTTPATQRALQLIRDTPEGIISGQISRVLDMTNNRTKLTLSSLSKAGLAKPVQDGKGSMLWLTPERAAELTKQVRETRRLKRKARAKIRDAGRNRSKRNPPPPKPPKPRPFSFALSDDEIENGRRSVVSANEALPLRIDCRVRWVFDLGRAA